MEQSERTRRYFEYHRKPVSYFDNEHWSSGRIVSYERGAPRRPKSSGRILVIVSSIVRLSKNGGA